MMLRTTAAKNLFVSLFLALASCLRATNIYWQPTSETNSWLVDANWSPAHVPEGTDTVYIATTGVCALETGSDVVADRLYAYGPSYSPLPKLLVEDGANLTLSNYFRVGGVNAYGSVEIKGTVRLVNNNNAGAVLGGYDDRFLNSLGVVDINGGTLALATPFCVGGASTGRVTITNGGMLTNSSTTYVGMGYGTPDTVADGTLVLDGGTWFSGGGMGIGQYSGARGLVQINDGTLWITNKSAAITIANNTNSVGRLELNGGEMKGSTVERETLTVGLWGSGTFVQNGGTGTVIGVSVGAADGAASTAIFSNGVFYARPTSGSWPAFVIRSGGSLFMAGGTFEGFSSASSGYVTDGGTLVPRLANRIF
jgi:hypothetical protein